MEEQTPKKFHFTKQMKIGLAVVLVLCIGCGLVYLDTAYGSGKIRSLFVKSSVTQNKGNPSAGVLAEIPLDAGSSTSFAVFDQAFLLCTKDGAKYYNSVGDQKWNDTFTMTTPTVIQEGSFMAVGDLGGKNVRVYDESGLLYNVQLEGNLSQFALNQNGYLSLLEKKDSGYEVKIYNSKGTLLKGRVEETAGVYPISTDVSDDNKSFAVSYVDTTDVYPIGRVLFFYVNPEDSENYTDSLYASAADKADEIIGTISYRSNGVLAAVSDKGVYGFRDSEEVWSYHLTNVVNYVSFQQKDRVVLIRQYRYTLGGYVYEFPAGLVEPGEDLHEGAVREMYEETGLVFTPLHVNPAFEKPYFTTVGLTDESCATVYGYASGEISKAAQEDSEEIEVVLADRNEVRRILKEERVAIMCAYMLMHFLKDEEPFEFLNEEI